MTEHNNNGTIVAVTPSSIHDICNRPNQGVFFCLFWPIYGCRDPFLGIYWGTKCTFLAIYRFDSHFWATEVVWSKFYGYTMGLVSICSLHRGIRGPFCGLFWPILVCRAQFLGIFLGCPEIQCPVLGYWCSLKQIVGLYKGSKANFWSI